MEEIIRIIDRWLENRSAYASRDFVDLLLDIRGIAAAEAHPQPSPEDYEAALAEIAA